VIKKKEKAHLTVFFLKERKRRKSCSFLLPYNSQKDKKKDIAVFLIYPATHAKTHAGL